jgi:energy-coupling factor transporter transmembrane protein EcfT
MRHFSAPARLLVLLLWTTAVATLRPDARSSLGALAAAALVATGVGRPRARWLAARIAVASLGVVGLALPFVFAGDAGRALALAARAFFCVWVALALASSIALAELPGAMRALGAPVSLAATVYALFWQMENVTAEGRRLVLARRLRGATGGFGPDVLALLFVRTARRAERVDLALRLRGATARSLAPRAQLGLRDLPVVAIALALAIALHLWV